MPFTPGTASYSLLMASLQAPSPAVLPLQTPAPSQLPPLPTALGATSPRRLQHPPASPGVMGTAVRPPSWGHLPSPLSSHRSAAEPFAASLPLAQREASGAPPSLGPVPPSPQGLGGGGGGAPPGDLCPGVEVEGPHGAQHLDAPHVLQGGRERRSEQSAAAITSPVQVRERRAEELGARDKAPVDTSSKALMHSTISLPTPTCPAAPLCAQTLR